MMPDTQKQAVQTWLCLCGLLLLLFCCGGVGRGLDLAVGMFRQV